MRSRCHAPAADPSQSADLQIDTVPRSVSPSTRFDSHRPRRRLTEEDDHGRRALAVIRDRPYPPPHDVPPTRTGPASEGGRDVVDNVGERGRNGDSSGIQKKTRPLRGARWLQLDAQRASHLTEVIRREMRQMHPSLPTSSSPHRSIAPSILVHPRLYSFEYSRGWWCERWLPARCLGTAAALAHRAWARTKDGPWRCLRPSHTDTARKVRTPASPSSRTTPCPPLAPYPPRAHTIHAAPAAHTRALVRGLSAASAAPQTVQDR